MRLRSKKSHFALHLPRLSGIPVQEVTKSTTFLKGDLPEEAVACFSGPRGVT